MVNRNCAPSRKAWPAIFGVRRGLPIRTVYYVAEEDPSKAEAIIAAFMAPNEKVQAYGPLPEAAVKALGLKPGSFKHA